MLDNEKNRIAYTRKKYIQIKLNGIRKDTERIQKGSSSDVLIISFKIYELRFLFASL